MYNFLLHSQGERREGQVYYEPDEADDLDESDPDEDLDV